MSVYLVPSSPDSFYDQTNGGLRQDCSVCIGERERHFHVFLPSAYDGKTLLPLVVSLHGSSGYQPQRDYWLFTAEREGFVLVYPEALKEVKWNIWGLRTDSSAPDDIQYLDAVLDYMTAHFAVDPSRIYMHGQSMGDNMASYYAYLHPQRLAALAVTSGPVLPSVMYTPEGELRFEPKHPLPVTRTHGENDYACGLPSTYGISKQVIAEALDVQEQINLRHIMDSIQKGLWKHINGIHGTPRLFFDLEKNVEFYRGEQADLLFYSIAGGVHRPFRNLFDSLWECSLAGYRREGSRCVREYTSKLQPDPDAIAFAEGADSYYAGFQVQPLGQIHVEIQDDSLYLSAKSLAQLFPHLNLLDNGPQAIFSFGGHELQCAAGRELMLLDGYVKLSSPPYLSQGDLMIPAAQFLPLTGSFQAACRLGAAYITSRPFRITLDGAAAIKEMLGTAHIASPAEALQAEKAIRDKIQSYLQNEKGEMKCHS